MSRTEEDFRNRIQAMAHKATLEEVIAYHDQKIESETKQWGADYIYTKWAKDAKERAIKEFSEGKRVLIYTEEEHFGYGLYGEDVHASVYSDGTCEFSTHSSD